MWCGESASYEEVRARPEPVFLAGVVRTRAGRRQAVPHALLAARLFGKVPPREAIAFLEWLDTAELFGFEHLLDISGRTHPLNPALQAARSSWGARHQSPPEIGAVILARNEEAMIGATIASIRDIADQVIVMDDESDDATAEVAAAAGAQVIRRPVAGDFAAQRNAGLECLRTRWAMSLDADTPIEPELAGMLRLIASRPDLDAGVIFRPTFVGGDGPFHWPETQLWLHAARLRFRNSLHEIVTGWRRAVYTPANGPYIVHRPDRSRFIRATLRYAALDPSPYPPELLARYRAELHELEGSGSSPG